MPNKSSADSVKDYLRQDYDRWRLLVRNPQFRQDLAAYLRNCGPSLSRDNRRMSVLDRRLVNKFQRLKNLHLAKWGIENVPDPALMQEEYGLLTPTTLESWYKAARKERPDFRTRTFSPVCLWNIRMGERSDEVLAEFRLDISLPVDHLIALMSKEVRSWYWKSIGDRLRGKPQSLDFQLTVYDLLHPVDVSARVPTFADVARRLRRRSSTIRDAYFAAQSKIGISKSAAKRGDIPQPGPITECDNLKCRNATTPQDFCRAHRQYVEKDKVSQRDLLGLDYEAIEHIHADNHYRPDPTHSCD